MIGHLLTWRYELDYWKKMTELRRRAGDIASDTTIIDLLLSTDQTPEARDSLLRTREACLKYRIDNNLPV